MEAPKIPEVMPMPVGDEADEEFKLCGLATRAKVVAITLAAGPFAMLVIDNPDVPTGVMIPFDRKSAVLLAQELLEAIDAAERAVMHIAAHAAQH